MNFRPLFLILSFLIALCGCNAPKAYVPETGRCVRPRMQTLASEHRDGYECRLVEFSVDDSYTDSFGRKVKSEERIKAYLLVPDAARAGKCPALVMLHDHGARFDIGKEKLVRPLAAALPKGENDHIMKSSLQWVNKCFDGVYFADSLASAGYVVLVADALYWGERSTEDAHLWSHMNYDDAYVFPDGASRKDAVRQQKNKVYEGQRQVYADLASKGVIWAEKILRDDVASVKLLSGLPYVDKDRIGAFGFSMGAHRCWLLAAFCKEVRGGVALSWMTSLNGYDGNNASDLSMRIQPMRDYMDFGDIGMYLAPKPMLFLNGETDHLFPKELVETAFDKLHSHYQAAGIPDAVMTEFFDGGHYCGKREQARTAEFFMQIL